MDVVAASHLNLQVVIARAQSADLVDPAVDRFVAIFVASAPAMHPDSSVSSRSSAQP